MSWIAPWKCLLRRRVLLPASRLRVLHESWRVPRHAMAVCSQALWWWIESIRICAHAFFRLERVGQFRVKNWTPAFAGATVGEGIAPIHVLRRTSP